MNSQQVHEFGNQLIADAAGNPTLTVMAWEASQRIIELYAELDANAYCDDPMSEYAPSECFGKHMERWTKLQRNAEAGLQMAQKEYEESMREPTPAEMEDMPW